MEKVCQCAPVGLYQVPFHDDWTHEVGDVCPCIVPPSHHHGGAAEAGPLHEPHWIDPPSMSVPSFQAFASGNPNVQLHKWIPKAEDGDAGVRLRQFLDASLTADTV